MPLLECRQYLCVESSTSAPLVFVDMPNGLIELTYSESYFSFKDLTFFIIDIA